MNKQGNHNTKQLNDYAYGIHSVLSVLKNSPNTVSELYLARKKPDTNLTMILEVAKKLSIPVKTVSNETLDGFAPSSNHQGIVAKITNTTLEDYSENDINPLLDSIKEPHLILLLDSLSDPHNLGACLRTSDAFGVHMVIANKDKAVGMTPSVRKVACGAAETVPFVQVTNLARTMDMLKERGIWFYGTTEKSELSVFDAEFKGSLGFVLGAEGSGMRRLTSERCDFLISIPMMGSVPSLNVSVAAGVFLFEVTRQRRLSAVLKK